MNGGGCPRGQAAPANPWVRPYVLTSGRTRGGGRGQLLIHTLVSAPGYDPVFAVRLLPEARALYDARAPVPSRWLSCRRIAACRWG